MQSVRAAHNLYSNKPVRSSQDASASKVKLRGITDYVAYNGRAKETVPFSLSDYKTERTKV